MSIKGAEQFVHLLEFVKMAGSGCSKWPLNNENKAESISYAVIAALPCPPWFSYHRALIPLASPELKCYCAVNKVQGLLLKETPVDNELCRGTYLGNGRQQLGCAHARFCQLLSPTNTASSSCFISVVQFCSA